MRQQHLVIIGGVASGPAAAAEARRASPDIAITLFESGKDISYSACEMPHLISGHIDNANKLIRYTPDTFSEAYRVDVKTKHTVLSIDVENRKLAVHDHRNNAQVMVPFDRLVLAMGASAQTPRALQRASRDLFVLRTLEDVQHIHGALTSDVRHAVVVGSGYVGLDAAWALQARGIRTTLMAPSGILQGSLSPAIGAKIETHFRSTGVQLRKERAVDIERAGDGKIIAVLTDKGEKIGCDFVLQATGTEPRTELAREAGIKVGSLGGVLVDEHMKTSKSAIWACGDCTQRTEMVFEESIRLPLSLQAFRSGRIAGRNAARGGRGRQTSAAPAVYAAALGLGQMEVAHTGWSAEAAHRLGKNVMSATATHRTASSLSPHHPIHIELVAEVGTGRLVGGQVIGGRGSAERINVITSIIRARGSVDDLYNLDFIYAPTLAPAHDPLLVTARLLQKKLRA